MTNLKLYLWDKYRVDVVSAEMLSASGSEADAIGDQFLAIISRHLSGYAYSRMCNLLAAELSLDVDDLEKGFGRVMDAACKRLNEDAQEVE